MRTTCQRGSRSRRDRRRSRRSKSRNEQRFYNNRHRRRSKVLDRLPLFNRLLRTSSLLPPTPSARMEIITRRRIDIRLAHFRQNNLATLTHHLTLTRPLPDQLNSNWNPLHIHDRKLSTSRLRIDNCAKRPLRNRRHSRLQHDEGVARWREEVDSRRIRWTTSFRTRLPEIVLASLLPSTPTPIATRTLRIEIA